MPHYIPATNGWTKLSTYQALWDPKVSMGKFYFVDFLGERKETPYMDAANFANVLAILQNEEPVYGNASTGSVTTAAEAVGEQEA
jgi:hypothetical protein